MSTPNFLYIGPDKAGSSWLHEVLLRHPQVFMPEAKDLYFFDRYYDHGLSWYLPLFAPAGPQHDVVGEVCQDYLFHPEAAARIAESLGDEVRFMVTLRDPADRAFSSYLYMLKQGEQHGTFLEALESPGRGCSTTAGTPAGCSRFLDRFGRERLHVAVFDDLVADPQRFVDELLAFLQVAPMTLPDDLLDARLPAGRARSVLVSRAVRKASDLVRERGAANVIGRVKRSQLVQRVLYAPAVGRQARDDRRGACRRPDGAGSGGRRARPAVRARPGSSLGLAAGRAAGGRPGRAGGVTLLDSRPPAPQAAVASGRPGAERSSRLSRRLGPAWPLKLLLRGLPAVVGARRGELRLSLFAIPMAVQIRAARPARHARRLRRLAAVPGLDAGRRGHAVGAGARHGAERRAGQRSSGSATAWSGTSRSPWRCSTR